MTAYEQGFKAAGVSLGLEKTAFWANAIKFLLPAGARVGRLAGFRGAATALGKRLMANKGMVALGAGMGALSPGTGGERASNAAIQGVAGAFGIPGMMAGSMLGPLVSNKMFGAPSEQGQ